MKKQIFTASTLTFALGLIFISPTIETYAITPNIPHTLIYEGRLLSKTSTPLSGDYVMRFSLWKTTDIVSGEINSDGSLNATSTEYGQWTEELPVKFTSQGYFSLILGKQTALSDVLLADHKYLQVEVKLASASDDEYQVLDVDFANDAIDRKHIASLPYAYNAEESQYSINAENAETAKTSDDNTFTIDPQNSIETAGVGIIELQFGATLNKILGYDISRSLFTFNDSVDIQGDLTLSSANGSATFSADNLTGDRKYTLPDEDADLVGTETTQVLTNKTIDASQNTIINLDSSSFAPSIKKQTITPLFPNTTFEAKTSNNQISIFMGNENGLQYYKISTEKSFIQTGKFLITLPLDEFVNFDGGSLSFLMKTTSNSMVGNRFDIKVTDDSGNIISSLTNQTTAGVWETKTIDLNGVLISGKNIFIEIDTTTSLGNEIYLGKIEAIYKGR